jgi:tRNA pseudouridine38-40 synthase
VGRRDFSAFAAGDGGVREVRRAAWSVTGELLRFEISANAFLRGMVRAIVGSLIWVGTGKLAPGDLGAIIASARRSTAGPSAPAQGLCLIAVEYEGRENMRIEDSDE